jgi:hypothetical protein
VSHSDDQEEYEVIGTWWNLEIPEIHQVPLDGIEDPYITLVLLKFKDGDELCVPEGTLEEVEGTRQQTTCEEEVQGTAQLIMMLGG